MDDRPPSHAKELSLTAALAALAANIQVLAADDRRVRAVVRSLGEVLIQIAAHAEQPVQQEEMPSVVAAEPPASSELPAPHRPSVKVAPAHVAAPPVYSPVHSVRDEWPEDNGWSVVTLDELPLIAQRCRLKAEAARWTLERAALIEGGAAIFEAVAPRDTALVEQARQFSHCYLWMFQRDALPADEQSAYTHLAGCYEAAADALEFACMLLADQAPTMVQQALLLAAEAQSALRNAVQALGRNSDRDQIRIFMWLREYSNEQQIYVERFMRANDSADPQDWPLLRERISTTAATYQASLEGQRRKRKLLKKAQYHRQLILATPAVERLYDWRKVFEAIDELVTEGTPASNIDLRDLLLPLIDLIPEAVDLSKPVQRVMSEIDSYLAARPTNVLVEATPNDLHELAQARQLLHGQAAVLIGGERRPIAEQQLKAALGLAELYWIDTRSHQTHTVFEPYVARDDVAVVLLAIRWASHGFSEVQAFCTRYAKPLVRLPTGYNANQVAYQIISQASGQLRSAAVAAE